MVGVLSLTPASSTVWLRTGTPASSTRPAAAAKSGANSRGWFTCTTRRRGLNRRNKLPSSGVTREGSTTGIRVQSRIDTPGRARRNRVNRSSRRSSEAVRGSPPDTSTSRTPACAAR